MPPCGLKFECANISWSTMEGLRSADDWERWSRSKLWRELPRGQEQRHRRSDLVLFLGTGWTSFKYSWVHHDNLDAVPTWRMQLAFFCCFFSLQLYFCLQPVPQTRYLANDGQAIVVRPTGNPAGTRVYEMKWDSVNKSIKVYNPLDGSFITNLPGRWTGRKEIGQAVRRCVKSFLERERG